MNGLAWVLGIGFTVLVAVIAAMWYSLTPLLLSVASFLDVLAAFLKSIRLRR